MEYIKPFFQFMGQLLGGTFESRVNTYISSELYGRHVYPFSLNSFERIFTYILFCFFFCKKLLRADVRNAIIINVFVLCFISYIYLAEIEVASTRMSALFMPAYMILYPNVLYEIKVRLAKQLLLIGLVIYSCYRMASYTKFAEYDYKNILFQKENIEERRKILKKSSEYQLKDIKKNHE